MTTDAALQPDDNIAANFCKGAAVF
jgi:hypothetical protein